MAKKKTSFEIDEDLWKQAVVLAASEGKRIGELLEESLQARLERASSAERGAIGVLLGDVRKSTGKAPEKARKPKKGGRR